MTLMYPTRGTRKGAISLANSRSHPSRDSEEAVATPPQSRKVTPAARFDRPVADGAEVEARGARTPACRIGTHADARRRTISPRRRNRLRHQGNRSVSQKVCVSEVGLGVGGAGGSACQFRKVAP